MTDLRWRFPANTGGNFDGDMTQLLVQEDAAILRDLLVGADAIVLGNLTVGGTISPSVSGPTGPTGAAGAPGATGATGAGASNLVLQFDANRFVGTTNYYLNFEQNVGGPYDLATACAVGVDTKVAGFQSVEGQIQNVGAGSFTIPTWVKKTGSFPMYGYVTVGVLNAGVETVLGTGDAFTLTTTSTLYTSTVAIAAPVSIKANESLVITVYGHMIAGTGTQNVTVSVQGSYLTNISTTIPPFGNQYVITEMSDGYAGTTVTNTTTETEIFSFKIPAGSLTKAGDGYMLRGGFYINQTSGGGTLTVNSYLNSSAALTTFACNQGSVLPYKFAEVRCLVKWSDVSEQSVDVQLVVPGDNLAAFTQAYYLASHSLSGAENQNQDITFSLKGAWNTASTDFSFKPIWYDVSNISGSKQVILP